MIRKKNKLYSPLENKAARGLYETNSAAQARKRDVYLPQEMSPTLLFTFKVSLGGKLGGAKGWRHVWKANSWVCLVARCCTEHVCKKVELEGKGAVQHGDVTGVARLAGCPTPTVAGRYLAALSYSLNSLPDKIMSSLINWKQFANIFCYGVVNMRK